MDHLGRVVGLHVGDICGLVTLQTIAPIRPFAEVDQFAPRGAKGLGRVVLPSGEFFANRAFIFGDHSVFFR